MKGGQGDYEHGYDMLQTTDSGYLVAATFDSYYDGTSLALRKLDKSGNFTWDTTFTDADKNFIGGTFYAMDKVDDSTFVLTGKRDYLPGSAEDLDVLFAKIRVYNDSVRILNLTIYEREYNDRGYDIAVLPDDGGYVICGTGPNENDPTYTAGFVMRIDTAGNLLWRETYARQLIGYTTIFKLHLNADNDILVLAQTNGGSVDPTLLKYSPDGDLLQKKHFNQGDNEPAYDFAVDEDGKIYILASTYDNLKTWASVLKVKDICPVITPDAALENEQPVLGEDIVVHVQDTRDVWEYSLVLLKDSTVLARRTGNNGTIDLLAIGLNNDDVSDGLGVSVIEPGVDCYKNSDTLYPEFICPVEAPAVSLGNPAPYFGDDVVVNVSNTNDSWEYTLLQIKDNVTLGTAMGNGSTYTFTVSGLTNEDVAEGLVVSAMLPGFDECVEYSDTLHLEFIDGIEDIYQKTLQIVPNPTQDFVTITDTEHMLSKLAVYNMRGKVILEKAVPLEHNRVRLSDLPEGFYLFRITYETGTSIYRKVLKQ
jgi:hypothetical protein